MLLLPCPGTNSSRRKGAFLFTPFSVDCPELDKYMLCELEEMLPTYIHHKYLAPSQAFEVP